MKPRVFFCSLTVAVTFAAAQAGPLQNGAFEQDLGSEWSKKNATPTGGPIPAPDVLRVAGTRTLGTGAWVIETTGRDHVQDGPMQSNDGALTTLTSTLTSPAFGNGSTYTTRVWVKLDASAQEASFRCLLRWRDGGVQQIPLILAEAVIIQPGVWVEATGTATLTWVTSLSSATVDFEVEQLHKGVSPTPPPNWFPAFQMDDLQMELDDDGDGLWDSEESSDHEQTTVSFSDAADSDGDRMTDDWETAHGLNPCDADDATLDPDGDEFTNVQEYFGATDPQSAGQFPGKPSDPDATFRTRALLRYLALRPWREQVLVGQMVSDNATDYAPFVSAFAAQPGWGRWPAILGLAFEGPIVPNDITASVNHAIPFASAGGIAQIKWAMWNPWTGGNHSDVSKIDVPGLLDPAGTPTTNNTAAENQAARAVVLGWVDMLAAEIKRYNTETNSAPIMIRPISEMNGGWFWWGHRSRLEYLGLWNLIRDRLMTHHCLHNIIWVYESAQTEHSHPLPNGSASASDYYYPGDDRVDIMAHNLYDDDWILPWDANKIYSRYPKIYGVPQAGPGKDLPTSRDGHFDNMNYITQITARYPRMSFFIVWNSFSTNGGATNNKIAIIDSTHPDQLMTDTRVITRDELGWQPATGATAAPESSTQVALNWIPPTGGDTGIVIETSPNGTTGWIDAATTAPAANAGTVGGLIPAATGWFRLRALHGADDSLPTDPFSAATWSYFQQWKSDTLGDYNAPDLADGDNDGAPILLEYALATDPFADSSAEMPKSSSVVVGSDTFLTLQFRRLIGASGLTYTVESSSDLAIGQWLTEPIPYGTPANNGDGTENVTYRDIVPIAGAPKRFMRLRVTSP